MGLLLLSDLASLFALEYAQHVGRRKKHACVYKMCSSI